jgi:hypothetical protein
MSFSRARKRALVAIAGAFIYASLGVSPTADAAPRSVALGEVSTRVVRSDVDLSDVLRSAVTAQLATLETPPSPKGPVILSAALVGMETQEGRVTCVVSATLRTARGGNMLAIVEGRAGVVSDAPAAPAVARRAVEAAARAAVVRVPDALR